MAYGNWGAFVYKNNKRRKDKEDVGVFDTDEANVPTGMRIFANLMKNREKYGSSEQNKTPWHEHSHHAVLGDGPVRLVGYKSSPELFIQKPSGEVERVPLPDVTYNDGCIKNASYWFSLYDQTDEDKNNPEFKRYEGFYTFSAKHFVGNCLKLRLEEPDGTVWTAVCGMEYGAGFIKDTPWKYISPYYRRIKYNINHFFIFKWWRLQSLIRKYY